MNKKEGEVLLIIIDKVKMKKIKNEAGGFTLIELLIVIGIIAILAAAVVITITPGERLKSAREATRASHMAAIGTAFHITVVEDDEYTGIGNILAQAGCGATTLTTYRDFDNTCAALVNLGSAPKDPLNHFYQVKSDNASSVAAGARLVIQTSAVESDLGELTY